MDYIIDMSGLSCMQRAAVYRAVYRAVFLREGGPLPNSIRNLNSLSCTAVYVRTGSDGARVVMTQNGDSYTYNRHARELWDTCRVDGTLLNL